VHGDSGAECDALGQGQLDPPLAYLSANRPGGDKFPAAVKQSHCSSQASTDQLDLLGSIEFSPGPLYAIAMRTDRLDFEEFGCGALHRSRVVTREAKR
jgi:hypothetical protein